MRKIKTAIAFAVILCFALAMVSCGKEKQEEPQITTTEKSTYTNADGKTSEELNKEKDNFYGTWTGTSGTAENLYGNITLVINEDGTIDFDVTDEKFAGTWEKIDGGITFTSEYISGEMYFGAKCKLVIHEEGITPITLVHEE